MNQNIKITIIHPTDPFADKVSGIDTFIKNFIKHSPRHFDINFIGISTDFNIRRPKIWMNKKLGEKRVKFFALFYEKNLNIKTRIPLALRFTLSLILSNLKIMNSVLFFHRIEPAFLYKYSRLPKVMVVHNDVQKLIIKAGSEVLWSKFPKIYQFFERNLIASVDRVLTVSKNTLAIYKAKYQPYSDRFSFIPTMVDNEEFSYVNENTTRDFKKKLAQIYDIPPNHVWILFVGRLQVQKNPIRLIDSYCEYLKYNRLSSLIIVGEGNLKNKVRELVGRKNLQNCVRMLGSLNQKELSLFYKCSDVMLVTSNFEGMPMSILEALACGLPVVTTDVGEVNRVVINGKSGEVVQNSDPEKIAEKVQLVVKHRDIYSKKNCAECVKMFSPEKIFIKLNENLKILYKNKFS